MKIKRLIMIVAMIAMTGVSMNGQNILNGLGNKVKKGVQNAVSTEVNKYTGATAREKAKENVVSSIKTAAASSTRFNADDSKYPFVNNGKVWYVSKQGSNSNSGTSASSPFKSLQKALNSADDGDVIYVAAGNYTGLLDVGYFDINKYVSIVGGFTEDFSSRDPYTNRTYIQTNPSHVDKNGSKALFEINVTGSRTKTLLVDGFGFDLGMQQQYAAPIDDPAAGWPEGCLTGRGAAVGEPVGGCPTVGGATQGHQLMHGYVEGNLVVRNCVFCNGHYYAIQMMNKGGNFEIYNNVFVANSYAACQVDAQNKEPNQCYVNFHDNTVLFSWCRTKVMEDMGYGFRFMSLVDADVHDNIFAGSNLGGLDKTHADPNVAYEMKRQITADNNRFVLNRADMILPSASYMWLELKADQFEDLTEIEDAKRVNFKSVKGNKELTDQNFLNAISQPYLKGFMNLEIISSQSYNENSPANLYRAAHGMNKMGTELVRVSMYANRYPFEDCYKLFGATSEAGAQRRAVQPK